MTAGRGGQGGKENTEEKGEVRGLPPPNVRFSIAINTRPSG